MNFIRQIERLKQLNKLIEQERTGTPDDLARRLGISRSKLYELLDCVRGLGKNVAYQRSTQTFYYQDEESQLHIDFSIKLVSRQELKKVNGGLKIFSSVLFSGRSGTRFTSSLID